MPALSPDKTGPQTLEGSLRDVHEALNALPDHGQRAHVLLWVEQATTEQNSDAERKRAEAIAYLEGHLRQALTDSDKIAAAEKNLEELHQNLNRNRIEAGEAPLFPQQRTQPISATYPV
jgi:HEAT repeat protein